VCRRWLLGDAVEEPLELQAVLLNGGELALRDGSGAFGDVSLQGLLVTRRSPVNSPYVRTAASPEH